LEETPGPNSVPRPDYRDAVRRSGYPWRVRDKSSGIELVLIPPGRYVRGASDEDPEARDSEKPVRNVVVARAFYIGRFEITNAQFKVLRPDHNSGRSVFRDATLNNDNQPVVMVSWDDAVAFCDARGMRLPTEDEWEYACRAGTRAARYGDLDAIGWHEENSGGASHSVGQKAPNGFGLYDMLGNASELCSDVFVHTDPLSELVADTRRVEARAVRGGSYFAAGHCRASYRDGLGRTFVSPVVGFRVVRDP
jgi:sulfatase modifying factor 1